MGLLELGKLVDWLINKQKFERLLKLGQHVTSLGKRMYV